MSASEKVSWRRLMAAPLLALCVLGVSAQAMAQEPAGESAPGSQPEAGEGEQPEAGDGEQAPQAPAPRPKVMILPTDRVEDKVSALIAERVDDTLRKRIKEEKRVVLMPGFTEVRKQLAGQGQSSAVVYQAEQLYTSGIGLLTAGENEKAVEAFQRAVELMEQNLADLQNYDVLSDSLSNLALAYFLTGYDLDGRKRMKQFAHLRPNASVNVDKFPKELLAVLTEEQAKIAKAGPGKLTITSNVQGAQVFIDGVERGVTPLTVDDVGFGYHYLVVRDGKGGAHASQIRVKGRKSAQAIEAPIQNAGAVAKVEGQDALPSYYTDILVQLRTGVFDDGELKPYLSELSKQAGAPYLGWVLLHKDPMGNYVATPFVWRAADSRMVRVKDTVFNFELSNLAVGVNQMSSDIATALETMPDAGVATKVSLVTAPVVAAGPAVRGPGDEARDPVIIAPPKEDRVVVVTPPPEVEDTDRRERRRKILRNVGLGTAAAVVVGGLVAGSVVLFSGEDDPDEADGFSAEVSW